MKQFISYLIFYGIFLSCFSCNSNKKTKNRQQESIDNNEKINVGENQNSLLDNNSLMGSFRWGINDDAFQKNLNEWSKSSTVNGYVTLGELKVKNNGITPTFDKDGHLEGLKIELVDFSMHPEFDYAEIEKQQINQVYLKHNQKIKQLITLLSDDYGSAFNVNFDENSYMYYLSDIVQPIAKWLSNDTSISLYIHNTTFSGMYGCKLQMWIDIKKI